MGFVVSYSCYLGRACDQSINFDPFDDIFVNDPNLLFRKRAKNEIPDA
jgi:hypothetical protein